MESRSNWAQAQPHDDGSRGLGRKNGGRVFMYPFHFNSIWTTFHEVAYAIVVAAFFIKYIYFLF